MLVQRSSFISNTSNSGAGINNSGLVAIDECTFSDNSTTGYDGAGLNNSGTAVATNSTFVANRAFK
ncbi:MAG: hypothetical protein IPK16_03410 [Anaerolineales bacterium]|nr:hypothetical protein [Anaerolineales bacterium]